jgi:hypothetical protein
LLLVCFVMAPSSQELEPPANLGRFSAGLPCLSAQAELLPEHGLTPDVARYQ